MTLIEPQTAATAFRPSTIAGNRWRGKGEPALVSLLDEHPAVVLRGAMPGEEAAGLASRVLSARADWTPDFGGDQFALGRAFYTHLETGKSREYFAGARASDALLERVLPGLQARTLDLMGRLLGGEVRQRPGFCGPGVHVFPASGKVAREGGVVHFDLEGLTEYQKATGAPSVSLVWTLQPGVFGGGLRLWEVLYEGIPDSEVEPCEYRHATVRSEAGDALFFDSLRLHQIRPFRGERDRISVTAHAVEVDRVEVDRGVWEVWF